jgi:hypothetical protein
MSGSYSCQTNWSLSTTGWRIWVRMNFYFGCRKVEYVVQMMIVLVKVLRVTMPLVQKKEGQTIQIGSTYDCIIRKTLDLVGEIWHNVLFLFSSLSGNVASDTTLLAKFQKHHASHSCFETSLIEPTFTITHYAGKVTYEIKVLSNCANFRFAW